MAEGFGVAFTVTLAGASLAEFGAAAQLLYASFGLAQAQVAIVGLRAVLVATRIVKLESLAQAGALASRVLALALRGALLPPAMFCSATVPAPASVLAGPGLPLGPALATRDACPAGRYAAAGCTSYAARQYQPSVGADRCEPCAAGRFAGAGGAAACAADARGVWATPEGRALIEASADDNLVTRPRSMHRPDCG